MRVSAIHDVRQKPSWLLGANIKSSSWNIPSSEAAAQVLLVDQDLFLFLIKQSFLFASFLRHLCTKFHIKQLLLSLRFYVTCVPSFTSSNYYFRFVSTSLAGNVVTLAAMHADDSLVTEVFIFGNQMLLWAQLFARLCTVITATWIHSTEQNTLWMSTTI